MKFRVKQSLSLPMRPRLLFFFVIIFVAFGMIMGAISFVAVPQQVEIKSPFPQAERLFVEAVTEAGRAYIHARNTSQPALRPERAKLICNLAWDRRAQDWLGSVVKAEAGLGGHAAVVIRIAPSITVESTPGNEVETGMEPGSLTIRTLANLKSGQVVSFSGVFLESKTDCIATSGPSDMAAMADPDFLLRLSSIRSSE